MAENDAPQGGGTTTQQQSGGATATQERPADGGKGGSRRNRPQSTPGSHDLRVGAETNPSTEQVIPQAGREAKAEGQRIREQAQRDAEDRDTVTLSEALNTTDPKLRYDESGALVNEDGKRIALAADASDPDVGWTVQHAGAHVDEDDRVHYPAPGNVPDQTVHPKELPDPLAAVRAGLLPQNTEVLNVDPDKFKGKKDLEP